jgi:hypothetical protein
MIKAQQKEELEMGYVNKTNAKLIPKNFLPCSCSKILERKLPCVATFHKKLEARNWRGEEDENGRDECLSPSSQPP